MKITIRDIDHLSDLASAIEALTRAAREEGSDFFTPDEQVVSRLPEPEAHVPSVEETAAVVGLSVADYAMLASAAAAGIPIQDELPLPPGDWAQPQPLRYVPCPDRGQHVRLSDCWMCWSDAHADSFGSR